MRISDWSSDVCSSDLPAERALTRFRRGGETAAQRAGDSTRRAANRRRWRDERIAAQRAARGLWHEAQRGEADQAGEDHVISGHEGSEEHTSELQSLMRNSYAVFCLKKKKQQNK